MYCLVCLQDEGGETLTQELEMILINGNIGSGPRDHSPVKFSSTLIKLNFLVILKIVISLFRCV